MARCSNCSKNVAYDAVSCPQCGKLEPAAWEIFLAKAKAVLFFIFIWIIYASLFGEQKPTNNTENLTPETTTEQSADKKWEIVRAAPDASPENVVIPKNSYRAEGGIAYQYKANSSGIVLTSSEKTLYLGKDCDAIIKDMNSSETASWSWTNDGVSIKSSGGGLIYFPDYSLIAGTSENCKAV